MGLVDVRVFRVVQQKKTYLLHAKQVTIEGWQQLDV